jgi:organic hydroperoxide reductase OsmC/OhrA
MQPLPHRYAVTAVVGSEPEIILETAGVAPLRTALPLEFGGSGDRWSPETLLVAAVGDCYALTFRGLAKRANLTWTSLRLEVVGTLDRVDHVTRFVEFHLRAQLQLPDSASEAQATRLLTKADETCLITRSLTATTFLKISIETVAARVA